jgi:hypothetical protein
MCEKILNGTYENDLMGLPFRYIDFSQSHDILETIKQKAINDELSEDIKTELVNNETLDVDLRSLIFDTGIVLPDIITENPEIVKKMYNIYIETLTQFTDSDTPSSWSAINSASYYLQKLFIKNCLPESLQLDLIYRQQDLTNEALLVHLSGNTKSEKVMEILSDIDKVGLEVAIRTLTYGNVKETLPLETRTKNFDKIIKELDATRNLKSRLSSMDNIYNNCGLTQNGFDILTSFNDEQIELSLVTSLSLQKEFIEDLIQQNVLSDKCKFYAQTNLYLKENNSEKLISETMKILSEIEKQVKREDLCEVSPEDRQKYIHSVHSLKNLSAKENSLILSMVTDLSKKYTPNSLYSVTLELLEKAQKEEIELQKCLEEFPFFTIHYHNNWVVDIDKIKSISDENMQEYVNNGRYGVLVETQNQLSNLIGKYLENEPLAHGTALNLKKQYENFQKWLSFEKMYNAISLRTEQIRNDIVKSNDSKTEER